VNLESYTAQLLHNRGFWASLHEIAAGYPWLVKRVALALDAQREFPRRNPLAYVAGLLVPHGGGGGGVLMSVAMLGMLAALAMPAYQDYMHRAVVLNAWAQSDPVRSGLAAYYAQNKAVPARLDAARVLSALPDGTPLALDANTMAVEVATAAGTLRMVPFTSARAVNGIEWHCMAGTGMQEKILPAGCRKG
jgi:Tfp pilus assembly major pilin PilA